MMRVSLSTRLLASVMSTASDSKDTHQLSYAHQRPTTVVHRTPISRSFCRGITLTSYVVQALDRAYAVHMRDQD
jgi:hypothetical protein